MKWTMKQIKKSWDYGIGRTVSVQKKNARNELSHAFHTLKIVTV